METGGRIVIQLAVLDWRNTQPGAREIETVWLTFDGVEEARTLDLPLLGESRAKGQVAFSNSPWPRVALAEGEEAVRPW